MKNVRRGRTRKERMRRGKRGQGKRDDNERERTRRDRTRRESMRREREDEGEMARERGNRKNTGKGSVVDPNSYVFFLFQVFDPRFFTKFFILQKCQDPNPNCFQIRIQYQTQLIGSFRIRIHNTGKEERR
jgi:hypothetical protein